jgi:hypothetical protein
VEITTACSDYCKVKVQQTSFVLLPERAVRSFVFDGGVLQAVTIGAISHESLGIVFFYVLK